jgi:hypothetical protein
MHALCTQHANTMLALRGRFTVLIKDQKKLDPGRFYRPNAVICTPQEKSTESEWAPGDGVRQ